MLTQPVQVLIRPVLCHHDSCTRTANYGALVDGVRRFCSRHKQAGMVRPSRADLTLPQAAGAHMSGALHLQWQVLLRSRCAASACMLKPAYAYAGDIKAVYCEKHKAAGMVCNIPLVVCVVRGKA